MGYVKELAVELNKLNNAERVKINIHYNLNGALLSLCEIINKEVNDHTKGLIHFGVKNISVPHISLCMGYVNNSERIEQILENVYEYTKNLAPIRIDPTRLYLKSIADATPKYLFLDILQNDCIMQQKIHLQTLLGNIVEPIEWDFLNEPAHITVGCYKSITIGVKRQIEKYHTFPHCDVNEVSLSIAGKKGVCLGNLKTFVLDVKERNV